MTAVGHAPPRPLRLAPGEHPLAIGLGANVGTETDILARFHAVRSILAAAELGPWIASPVYRTAPVGPVSEQPWFLNAVLVAPAPDLAAHLLMAALLDVEAALGRARPRELAQGPRPIDLDLLIAGADVVAEAAPLPLFVPHPRLSERAFVIRPLADVLGPDYTPPAALASLGELVARTRSQPVEATDLTF